MGTFSPSTRVGGALVPLDGGLRARGEQSPDRPTQYRAISGAFFNARKRRKARSNAATSQFLCKGVSLGATITKLILKIS